MKQFILALTAVTYCAIALPLQSKASGGEDWPIAYEQFYFQQYYPNQKWYQYQFEPNSPYYGNNYRQESPQLANPNAQAWRNYLKLDKTISDSAIVQYLTAYCEPNQTSSILLDKYLTTEAKQYLDVLKIYYREAISEGDAWNYATYTGGVKKDKLNNVIEKATILMRDAKSDFIKWRALHVMLRAYHNNAHNADCKKIFDKYYPTLTKDNGVTQYWCEGIYAGTNLRLGNNDVCNYYCARSWMNCGGDVSDMATTYKWGNRNWQSALKLCKTTADSISVISLHSATEVEPNTKLIEQLFKLNPNSDVLRLLWMRETQKVQHMYNADEFSFWSFGDRGDKLASMYKKPTVLSNYFALGEMLLNKAPQELKAMVANSLGFIMLHRNKVIDSKKYLTTAQQYATSDIDRAQNQVLQYQYDLRTNNNLSENEIAQMAKNIKQFKTPENTDINSYFMGYAVAPYFIKQGKFPAATLAYIYANGENNNEYYESEIDETNTPYLEYYYGNYLLRHKLTYSELESLQQKLDKQKGENDFENLVLNCATLRNNKSVFDFYACKRYMLEERWQDALAILPKLSKNYSEMPCANPVNYKLDDRISVDSARMTSSISKVVQLASKLKINADAGNARDQYLYGNLLYNMSMYGTCHNIVDDHWNYYMDQTPYYLWDSMEVDFATFNVNKNTAPMSAWYKNYFRMYNAMKYYKLALSKLNNKEAEAECLIMLAKCWQRQCPVNADYVKHAVSNPYFIQLKAKFASTQIAQEAASDCSYYKIYLGKKTK
jgi:hypothetical protein